MSNRRTSRRATLLAVAATLLAGTALALPTPAVALPIPNPTGEAAVAVANDLQQQLGEDRTAGSYLDSSGRPVVTITHAADAQRVQSAGAVPRLVTRSAAQLAAATAELDRRAAVPGTAWAVDPLTDQVVVSADSTVRGAALDRLTRTADGLGSAVRLEQVPGVFSTRVGGGDAIYGGGYRCSLGFNVRSTNSGTYYFLTAGHCGNIASAWYASESMTDPTGSTTSSTFPDHDYALVQYTDGSVPASAVDLYDGTTRAINTAANPSVGQTVSRSGSTSHVHSGIVTGLNTTVHYAQGTVRGLIKTTVCAEEGDSGGSLFAGHTALGLTSGGNGNCTLGGTTFFQPVTAALAAYGVGLV
ncbi:S1 family peptidase [Saccharothrix sp. ST-888]|uniref:S1 family peptidase n=1 Tax=Saccharothrix sp. ST-888 TaxID=1427391 RepID=UPI0005ECB224|nr:S1 family peptidase [Saccharothrix sp. ST-888]KJK57383.1 serine protease [Saccharothrix sp. ST-888]